MLLKLLIDKDMAHRVIYGILPRPPCGGFAEAPRGNCGKRACASVSTVFFEKVAKIFQAGLEHEKFPGGGSPGVGLQFAVADESADEGGCGRRDAAGAEMGGDFRRGNEISLGEVREAGPAGEGERESVGPGAAGNFPAARGTAAAAHRVQCDGLHNQRGVTTDKLSQFSGSEGGSAGWPNDLRGRQFLELVWRGSMAAKEPANIIGRGEGHGVVLEPEDKAAEFCKGERASRAGWREVAAADPVAEGLGGKAEEAGGSTQADRALRARGDSREDFGGAAFDFPGRRAAFPGKMRLGHGVPVNRAPMPRTPAK